MCADGYRTIFYFEKSVAFEMFTLSVTRGAADSFIVLSSRCCEGGRLWLFEGRDEG